MGKKQIPPIEGAVERFEQALSLDKPAAAICDVEQFYERHPDEGTAPLYIALKHHEKFLASIFKAQLSNAIERGRASAESSSGQSNEVPAKGA